MVPAVRPDSPSDPTRRPRPRPEPGSDALLLAAFARDGDDSAFGELVRRHGPVAHGVCRRVLADAADADDAYQAALIVLARRAGQVRDPGRLGPWLYGVALRCAKRAKGLTAARHARERPLPELPTRPAAADDWHDVRPVLDAEIERLPEKLRTALVLCELQGVDRAVAAARLNIPAGTLSSRLARAKDALRAGLVRRGVTLTAAGLTTALTEANAGAAGPPAAAVPSAATLALAHMETAVFVSSGLLKLLLALLTAAGLTAAGVALLPADPPPKPAAADAIAEEKAKLIGEWEVVSVKLEGRVLEGRARDEMVGAKVLFSAADVRIGGTLRYTLKPETTPKGIDLEVVDGPPAERKTIPGVYRLDGDALTLHLASPKAGPMARPADFESRADGATMLLVLKRAPADPVQAEKAKLVGEWRVVSVTVGDKPADRRADAVLYAPWRFGADDVRRGLGGTPYRLDPTADPKRLDIDTETGLVESTQAGIYKLDGDTLTVHSRTVTGGRAADRPAGFDPAPGRDTRLFVLQRINPAAEKAKLLGDWRVERVDVVGRPLAEPGPDKLVGSKAVITADEIRMKNATSKYALVLGTTPTGIDVVEPGEPGVNRKSLPGVYKLDGDTLTLHLPIDAAPRPTDFACTLTSPTMLIVLKRAPGDPVKTDKAKLTGTWSVLSETLDGEPLVRERAMLGPRPVTFTDTGITVVRKDATYTYALGTGPAPRHFDLTVRYVSREPGAGPGAASGVPPPKERTVSHKYEGIYTLDGDTLTLHVGLTEAQTTKIGRPKDFTPSKPGTGYVLVVLKRQRSPAPEPLAAAQAPAEPNPPAALGTLSGRVRVGGKPATAGRVTVYFGPGNTQFVGARLVGGTFRVERMPAGGYEIVVEAVAGDVKKAHTEGVPAQRPGDGPVRVVRDFDLK